MATRFEFVLPGPVGPSKRAAAEEALDEIERIEAQLSCHRATSEISAINREAAHRAVRVNPEVFQLLEQAVRLSQETLGAFDITIRPLLRVWGFADGSGKMPEPGKVAEARARVGWQHLALDAENHTVRFDLPGVEIDLGSIGKGHALDQAARILREHEIKSALLHGGTSSVVAWGDGPDGLPWKIALPQMEGASALIVPLQDASLSVSGICGKSFESGGKTFGHVVDPASGLPAQNALFAAVKHSSAAKADALSTALLARGPDLLAHLKISDPGLEAWVG